VGRITLEEIVELDILPGIKERLQKRIRAHIAREVADIVGHQGEETGAYIPMPKINLICQKCAKVVRPIAHNTGDGWIISLDCECQQINDAARFDWPKGHESLKGSELEAMGFEIV